jgi:cold-inducible RNA-binding protein
MMGKKLYVGNLSFDCGEADLHDMFGRVGSVASVNLVRDQMTGRPRGFAFVEMSTDEEAQAAISALNNTEAGGRTIAVNEARPKTMGGGSDRGRQGQGPRRRSEPRW